MKKIHRFLLATAPDDSTTIISEEPLVHLIKNVLKLSVGESCIVFSDGTNDYLSEIVTIEKHKVVLSTKEILPKKFVPKNVTACISILKRDSFELLVQKLTELGIAEIIPLTSEHTVKQALRLDRLQKISDEALEQSGWSHRVVIREPEQLEEVLENHRGILSCYFDMDGKSLEGTAKETSVFYIGPEGGWGDADKALFTKYKIASVSLGTPILRAETAAIVAGYALLWN